MSKYVCMTCGKATKLPDFCCGHSMVTRGSFVCKTCGQTAFNSARCCNGDMSQV